MVAKRLTSACSVDLWEIDLDLPPADEDVAALSEDERVRAARFAFDVDRRRFVAAHAGLRRVLATATGRPAPQLEFTYGANGKPALHPGCRLDFNLSHSGNLAWIGLGGAGGIGVDVEQLRPCPDAMALAAALFSRREQGELAARADADLDRAFLIAWTRKEACLKAVGTGLAVPSGTFYTGVEPEPRVVEIMHEGAVFELSVDSVVDRAGAVGAVARLVARRDEVAA